MNPNLAKVSEDAKGLMKMMLEVDPELRISASEATKWFALPIPTSDWEGWRICEEMEIGLTNLAGSGEVECMRAHD
jgi:hypothetical protein